jgi:phosphatidylserine/phosphatidylglycerophosphate/cardiolipin synthase-like enzyme
MDDSANRVAMLAKELMDMIALEGVCDALESGRLGQDSTGSIRSAISQGSSEIEMSISKLQEIWGSSLSKVSGYDLAMSLQVAAAAIHTERESSAKVQVVWTGPEVEGSYVRATREVVREIVRSAKAEVIVVGYWLAGRDDGDGIIEELVQLLADAVSRGVVLTMILDERQRSDGTDNRKVLSDLWPPAVRLPRLLTWRLPPGEKHLKLHAKVIVADDRDALVTSANLTWHAMDRNIEMGIRIMGGAALVIAKHLRLLDRSGILQSF